MSSSILTQYLSEIEIEKTRVPDKEFKPLPLGYAIPFVRELIKVGRSWILLSGREDNKYCLALWDMEKGIVIDAKYFSYSPL